MTGLQMINKNLGLRINYSPKSFQIYEKKQRLYPVTMGYEKIFANYENSYCTGVDSEFPFVR